MKNPSIATCCASFAVALMLSMAPLPEWAVSWRPEWVALTLIYWIIVWPRVIGIGAGWLLGLLVDAAQGTLLGEHALGFSIIAYITLRLHQRMRLFPIHYHSTFKSLINLYS